MTSNYMQAMLAGNVSEAQRLAGWMTPTQPSTALVDALESAIPYGLKALLHHRSSLSLLHANIEVLASPLQVALSAHQRASIGLESIHHRLQHLREHLPQTRFASFVQAMTTPATSLQDRVDQIKQLLAEPIGEDGYRPSDEQGRQEINAHTGLRIGDEAIAHVIRHPDHERDAQWWASLSHDAKFQTWVSIMLAIILLLPQIPGYINDYREWRDGSDSMSNEQGQHLMAAVNASKATLAELHALQRESAARDAAFQRESIALRRHSAMLMDSLVGQPCEVLVATSVRALDHPKRVIRRLAPGDLVLCMAHEGKWLHIAFDDDDGRRVEGWARKKHLDPGMERRDHHAFGINTPEPPPQ